MQKIHDRDPNFFESKSNQRKGRQGYIDQYQLDQKKGEDIWNHTFPKFLRRNRLKKEDFIRTRFRPNIPSSEIIPKTTSKPSGITEDAKSVVEQVKDELEKDSKEDKETTQLKTQTKEGGELSPVAYDHWDARAVGAVFDGLLAPLRALWPEMKGLSDEDKESIGRMLLPGFRRYGGDLFQYFIFPLFGTAGILGPKIVKGRKLHKEAQEKKKQKKLDSKLTEEARVNKLTCTFCNEMFDSAHIKSHQETCKKRIKTQ